MQLTIPAELCHLSDEDKANINGLMHAQCSAKRYAFNRMLEGASSQQIIHMLEDMFPLNWRYCEHAVRDAEAQIQSRRELLPLYLGDVEDRTEELKGRLQRVRSKEKRKVIERELAKLKKKKRFYEEHIENGTVPKTVFGRRRNLEALMKRKFSGEDWRELRNNQLYSIGQANQKGNANLRIVKLIEGEYRLQVRFINRRDVKAGKDGRKLRYKSRVKVFKLHIPAKFQPYLEWVINSKMAYSVRIIRKNGRCLVYISFKLDNAPLLKAPERVTSIDANPKGFAAAVVSRDGNLLAHRFFRDDRLIYASKEKRDNIVGVLVSGILGFAEKNNATIFVIENLNIRDHANFGKRLTA
ncbi:MAG: hypothetical protein ACP5PQ_07340 [Thermoproteota archaeon]